MPVSAQKPWVGLAALTCVLLAASCCLAQTDLARYVWETPSLAGKVPPKLAPVRQELARAVTELLDAGQLAPLYVQIGIAGPEFFFDDSAETLHALATAYPWLPQALQQRVKAYLAEVVKAHPPWTRQAYYPLNEGKRRELFDVPEAELAGGRGYSEPLPLGNLYPVWEYAQCCDEWDRVLAAWPQILAAYDEFKAKNWHLDPAQGDVYMNRYLSGLIGFARIARKQGAPQADEAARYAARELQALLDHYQQGVKGLAPKVVENVGQVDAFIGAGDAVFLKVVGHKSKVAKFLELSPEVGRAVSEQAPAAAKAFVAYVDLVMPGWYLTAEERQVHFGENFADYPDFALGVFQAKALIFNEPADVLAGYVDLPWCAGDLYYIEKLALTLRASAKVEWKRP